MFRAAFTASAPARDNTNISPSNRCRSQLDGDGDGIGPVQPLT